jgi:BirA family biotin operon repressor/biotin-[acetyl-CoA-carboxylase] ligase
MISGIGVNVTTEDFPEQISGKAASIGRFADRSRLAALIIAELYKLHLSSPEEFMEEYRRNCFLIGKEVGFYDGNERFRGTVADITDSCELVLVRDGKRCVFSHGEITDF